MTQIADVEKQKIAVMHWSGQRSSEKKNGKLLRWMLAVWRVARLIWQSEESQNDMRINPWRRKNEEQERLREEQSKDSLRRTNDLIEAMETASARERHETRIRLQRMQDELNLLRRNL